MPTDPRSGGIFDNQDMLEGRLLQSGQRRRTFAQRQQEWGHVVGLAKAAVVEIISPSERHHAPVALMAVKLKILKCQSFKLPHQVSFFFRRQKLRPVREPL